MMSTNHPNGPARIANISLARVSRRLDCKLASIPPFLRRHSETFYSLCKNAEGNEECSFMKRAMEETKTPRPCDSSVDCLISALKFICEVQALHYKKELNDLDADIVVSSKGSEVPEDFQKRRDVAKSEKEWFEKKAKELDAMLATEDEPPIEEVNKHRDTLQGHLGLRRLEIEIQPKYETGLSK